MFEALSWRRDRIKKMKETMCLIVHGFGGDISEFLLEKDQLLSEN